MLSERQIVFIK